MTADMAVPDPMDGPALLLAAGENLVRANDALQAAMLAEPRAVTDWHLAEADLLVKAAQVRATMAAALASLPDQRLTTWRQAAHLNAEEGRS